jgi:hypothetical protein
LLISQQLPSAADLGLFHWPAVHTPSTAAVAPRRTLQHNASEASDIATGEAKLAVEETKEERKEAEAEGTPSTSTAAAMRRGRRASSVAAAEAEVEAALAHAHQALEGHAASSMSSASGAASTAVVIYERVLATLSRAGYVRLQTW